MNWCFATVNGRLAEIFFEKKRNSASLMGHTYVKKGNYKTKYEKIWIEKDSNKFKLTYKKGIYKDLTSGKNFQCVKHPFD